MSVLGLQHRYRTCCDIRLYSNEVILPIGTGIYTILNTMYFFFAPTQIVNVRKCCWERIRFRSQFSNNCTHYSLSMCVYVLRIISFEIGLFFFMRLFLRLWVWDFLFIRVGCWYGWTCGRMRSIDNEIVQLHSFFSLFRSGVCLLERNR